MQKSIQVLERSLLEYVRYFAWIQVEEYGAIYIYI